MLLCSSTNHTWRTASASFPGALPCLCSMTRAASCRPDLLRWRSDRPPACSEQTRSSPASCVRSPLWLGSSICEASRLRIASSGAGYTKPPATPPPWPVRPGQAIIAPWPSPPPVPAFPGDRPGRQVHLQPAQVQALATCASTGKKGRLATITAHCLLASCHNASISSSDNSETFFPCPRAPCST